MCHAFKNNLNLVEMFNRFFYCLLVFLLIGTSCIKSNESPLIQGYTSNFNLEGEVILDHEFNVLYTTFLDTLLLTVANRDTLFHIYDKKLNHVSSFGITGRGPGEFPLPPMIEDVFTEGKNIKALVHDQFRNELLLIDISSSIQENSIIIESTFQIPQDLSSIRNIKLSSVGNRKYVGIYEDRDQKKLDEKRGGFLFNQNSGEFELFPLTNLSTEPFDLISEINLNARLLSISPDRERIAIALAYLPIIELFDLNSLNHTTYLFDESNLNKKIDLDEFKSGQLNKSLRDLYVTNNFIYILSDPMNNGFQEIKAFTWEGEAEVIFTLSENYPVSSFIVDEEQNIIYGTSHQNDLILKFIYPND